MSDELGFSYVDQESQSDFRVPCKEFLCPSVDLKIDEEADSEDIYEMALEILEADEAFRLESSGSISPESDVDRLLENADTERFSGDVTLIRIFSIRHEDTRTSSGDDFDYLTGSRDSSSHTQKYSEDGELCSNRIGTNGDTESKPSTRYYSDEPSSCGAFESTEFVSVDLNSDSRSVESDVFLSPTGTADPGSDPQKFESALICTAKFSNVRSKDARIRTALTVNSLHEDADGLGDRTESEVSLRVTSSDSLYSTTDDCFGDPALVGQNRYGTMNTSISDDECQGFTFREPSPEELFDEALETRSDLAGSLCSSIRMSPPQCAYFDAVPCSSTACVHRHPSPEDDFDLALETLSDVVDDSSSSVFVIAPRRTGPQKQRPPIQPSELLLNGPPLDANDLADSGKIALMEGGSSIDLDFRPIDEQASYSRSSRSSSCEAVPDDNPSHLGRLFGTDQGEPSELFTADELSEEAKDERHRRLLLEPWSSDCPSSPEPSFLADYSTDDCIGESEGDESLTDYEASSGIDSSSKNSFFQRLLCRREFHETMGLWGESHVTTNRDNLLDNIRICSIEDLLTDSENEKDLNKLETTEVTSAKECSLMFPLVHAKCPVFAQSCVEKVQKEDHSSQEVGVSLSPPIALEVRTDIQFARKSKIPKLPESRTTLSPVRISW